MSDDEEIRDVPRSSGGGPSLLQRVLDSVRGDRPMKGWERVLFYLIVIFCGYDIVTSTFLPGAKAVVGG